MEYEHKKVIEQQKMELAYPYKEIANLKSKYEQNMIKIHSEYKDEVEGLIEKLDFMGEEK